MSLDCSSLLRSLEETYRSLSAVREQLVGASPTGNGPRRSTIELLERLGNLEKDVATATRAERQRAEKMIVLEQVLLGNRDIMNDLQTSL